MQKHQITSESSGMPASAPEASTGSSDTASSSPADPAFETSDSGDYDKIVFTPEAPSSGSPGISTIVAAVLATVLLCCLAVGCFVWFRKRRANEASQAREVRTSANL